MTFRAQGLPAPETSDLGILVLLAYQGFTRRLHADVAAKGFGDLGGSDGIVMRIVGAQPRTVSELAALLEVTPQAAAQLVDGMERRGYVVRRQDPRDGRARLVGLSDRGRDLIDAARAFHRRSEALLVDELGRETIDQFRSVLGAMAEGAPAGIDRELRSLYL
ncbi:MarR family winged helix-turn-helix transcriptional regulator [Cellulomonas sp. PhB143]|uniref:MarR family winged helix-turn-helix transcriptional regulator n=1 Tax=Cellulomonas sp. PhB143 TaxID=2485186 RepID=UPI000FB5A717|nr:MarR family transcriptional regulator [Cellulomonas sp. PhB143]ROS72084.1 MarR family transcriptional regulator [Cellulomonas sp. PhB143]